MKDKSPGQESEIFTLHRYFIWANRMRDHYLDVLEAQGPPPLTCTPTSTAAEIEECDRNTRAWLLPVFCYCSYWLGSLYVLAEGWLHLKLRDPDIDKLLSNPAFVDHLRRYRNGVFHFHPEYMDKRFREYVDWQGGEEARHANDLHESFSAFFLEWFWERRKAAPAGGPLESGGNHPHAPQG